DRDCKRTVGYSISCNATTGVAGESNGAAGIDFNEFRDSCAYADGPGCALCKACHCGEQQAERKQCGFHDSERHCFQRGEKHVYRPKLYACGRRHACGGQSGLLRTAYSETIVNCAVMVMAGAGSKNCGLIAKIAGTVRLVALFAETAWLMRGPLNTAPDTAYAPRVELAPANTQRPLA